MCLETGVHEKLTLTKAFPIHSIPALGLSRTTADIDRKGHGRHDFHTKWKSGPGLCIVDIANTVEWVTCKILRHFASILLQGKARKKKTTTDSKYAQQVGLDLVCLVVRPIGPSHHQMPHQSCYCLPCLP